MRFSCNHLIVTHKFLPSLEPAQTKEYHRLEMRNTNSCQKNSVFLKAVQDEWNFLASSMSDSNLNSVISSISGSSSQGSAGAATFSSSSIPYLMLLLSALIIILLNKNQIELIVILSIYKYNQYLRQNSPVEQLHMWKSIGSIPSPTAKGKDDVAYQPFAQASRLRLNESQLSGESSPQFMQQYFSKKRSPEALPHRSHSQKSLQVLPMHPPITSLRDVVSPEPKSKPVSISSKVKDEASFIQAYKQIANDSISRQKDSHRAKNQQIYAELKRVKEEQVRLKKSVQNELNGLKNQIKETEAEILSRLSQASSEADSKKKEGLNPEILSKIRQQSQRFNERIRDIQNRKQQVKEKYRLKNSK